MHALLSRIPRFFRAARVSRVSSRPSLSLRRWLTLPFVVLILGVAALIGFLSYRTGSDVVDSLSSTLLTETVARIEQSVERHLVGSAAVLETAFPQGIATSENMEQDYPALRLRLWAATSLHTDSNNYVYYGNEAGQTAAMLRLGPQTGEWRTRAGPGTPRQSYLLNSIDAPLRTAQLSTVPLDPRTRPWYLRARASPTLVWTAVYIDAVTRDLVVTCARSVSDSAGHLQGVVATDVALHHLNAFLRAQAITPNSLAFIVEPGGDLIASSRTPNIEHGNNGENRRINARDSGDPLQLAAFRHMSEAIGRGLAPGTPGSLRFIGPDGTAAQLAYSRLRDPTGPDWLVVVAMPRSDYMQGMTANVMRTLAIGMSAAFAAALFGLLILNWLSNDLQHLTSAARRVGEGQIDDVIEIRGRGAIGELAGTFREMQLRLRTDALTGLANRDWLMRCIDHRIERGRRETDRQPFAVLFIDLNRFKLINDTLGHAGGDRVLIEVGARLRSATREGDTVARYAGDEFVVLLDGVPDLASAEKARDHISVALLLPLQSLAGSALCGRSFGGSVGLALYPGSCHNAEELVRQADQDMYRAKSAVPA
ncbi:MAG: hypothetical protein JWP29_2316 [Rhodoferax sp.]|nr:hypothetical protein [Rhodoferax sp.]